MIFLLFLAIPKMASLLFFSVHDAVSIPLKKIIVGSKFLCNYLVIDHVMAARDLCIMAEHVFLLQVI